MSGGSVQRRIKTLERHGLEVERTGGGHLKITKSGVTEAMYAPSTPGRGRANENFRVALKRILGVDVKGRL